MTNKRTRKIVRIDEDKCNGCGDCIPNCAEGALRIVNGKARLVAENLCDGLGACLGNCPQGAITVEERPADDFDEQAVQKHLHPKPMPGLQLTPVAAAPTHPAGGCPGSQMRMMHPRPSSPNSETSRPSQLGQWPVQLALIPAAGEMWDGANVLIAADCVPFAYAGFHEKLLAGKRLAIACPKLDNVEPYLQKLTAIFSRNHIQSVTVVRMEVPCCSGITRLVQAALTQANRPQIPFQEIIITTRGEQKT